MFRIRSTGIELCEVLQRIQKGRKPLGDIRRVTWANTIRGQVQKRKSVDGFRNGTTQRWPTRFELVGVKRRI